MDKEREHCQQSTYAFCAQHRTTEVPAVLDLLMRERAAAKAEGRAECEAVQAALAAEAAKRIVALEAKLSALKEETLASYRAVTALNALDAVESDTPTNEATDAKANDDSTPLYVGYDY